MNIGLLLLHYISVNLVENAEESLYLKELIVESTVVTLILNKKTMAKLICQPKISRFLLRSLSPPGRSSQLSK